MKYSVGITYPLEKAMALFLFLHLVIWTMVPAWVRHNLPLDAIEGTLWGHQLEWGYDKNPFMNAWLTTLAVKLGGESGWLIYGFSQLSVVICLWVVWQLGKKMFSPTYAFIAVLTLEGMQYFNFHAIDFNDNTLELGLWALTVYCFYLAITTRTLASWMGTGFFAALSMMTKYYTGVLLASLLLFLLFDHDSRQQFKTTAPYAGLGIFILICLPHMIWLIQHDFITIHYVFARASNQSHWSNHFFYPLQFAWQQFEVLAPTLALLLILSFPRKIQPKQAPLATPSHQDKVFLYIIALGPIGLTLLLSLLFGITLRAGWGMPLLSFFSLLLLLWLKPVISTRKIVGLATGIALLTVCFLSVYSYSLIWSPDPSSANFPGKSLAATIENRWHERYHTPLKYLAGSRWIGGNIAFYGKDHPAVFIEWNKSVAPWIEIKEMKKHGAVFVWDIDDHEKLPATIREQFTRLSASEIMTYDWDRNVYHLPKGRIGIAFLPPAGNEDN